MRYKVSVVKRITLLLMTMALAVAMVACQAATPKPGAKGDPGDPGAPGPAGPAGSSDNDAPMEVKPLPMLYVALGGSGATPAKTAEAITLGDHFKDAETPTLEYKVKSVDPEGVATVEIKDGKTVTVGKKSGTATVTIEVYDGVNDPIEGTFNVMVVATNVKPTVTALAIGDNDDKAVKNLAAKLYVGRGASTVTVKSVIYDFGEAEGSTGDDSLDFDAEVGNAGKDDDILSSVSVAKGSKPDTWDITLDPKKAGHQNVVITVKDKFGAPADTKWRFTVLVNTKPSVKIPLPSRTVTTAATDDGTETIVIASYFTTDEKAATQPMVLNSATPPVMEASGAWSASIVNTAGSVTHPDHIPDEDGGAGDEADLAADNADRTNDVTCSYSTSPDQTVTTADATTAVPAQMGSGSITYDAAATPPWTSLAIPDSKVGQYNLTIACRDAENEVAVSTATITVLQGG